jgi:hypothetical protein
MPAAPGRAGANLHHGQARVSVYDLIDLLARHDTGPRD